MASGSENSSSTMKVFLGILSILVVIFMGISTYSVGRADKNEERLDTTKDRISEKYVTKEVFDKSIENFETKISSLDSTLNLYMCKIDKKLETIIVRNAKIDGDKNR